MTIHETLKSQDTENNEELRRIEAPPSFINELLQAYPDAVIDEPIFEGIRTQAKAYNFQLQLDQMNGEVDRTRFVSEFAGICHSSDEVQEKLDAIAYEELEKLHENPQLRKEVFATLAKETCTMDALLWLDEEHGKVTQQLRNSRHPEAEAFKERNVEAIRQAETEAQKPPSLLYAVFKVEPPRKQTPEVLVVPTYDHGKLTAIKRNIFVPYLPAKNRELLLRLTPLCFQRDLTSGEQDPTTLTGFMSHFRKAGDPLVRATAHVIRDIRKNNANEQNRKDLDAKLREYFETHNQ